MIKYLIIIALGAGAGYYAGFKDAQEHDETIVARALDRVGGSARGKYKTDVDAVMENAERR
jgi:hypothetical protein